MAKQAKIVIRDARKKTGVFGFRVESRAKNGELLQISEVLTSVKAIEKHIAAMSGLYKTDIEASLKVEDITAKKVWATKK